MTDQVIAERGGGPKAVKRHEPGCIPSGEASFYQQLAMMRRAFMGSPLRNLLFWVAFGILALIVATAFGQVLLNRWNQPFYDAIERRNVPDFLNQLMVFGYIAGVLLLLNIAQGWLNRYLHIKLREGLVRDLLDHWLRPGRALQAEAVRRARRQPRPAPARGRLAPRRPLGRPRHRPHAGERAARELHRRPVGDLGRFRVPL